MSMGSNMKATIDIADALLRRSKETAARDHVTLRTLVEEGLRKVVEGREARRRSFKLRAVKSGGGGFQREFADGDWSRIRNEIYKGRGA